MPQYMPNIPMITPDDYVELKECDYKGEHYSVRDNGAIMRHAKGKKRPNDEKWTFGKKDPANGYMRFCGEAVHRIVATAFHGEAPSAQHVVDHIDTNRCNNRPENLRWLTKLENILLNENTLAKVIYICGSIDAFLENPELLFGHESEDANFIWMRAVTPKEAKATRENFSRLVSRPQDVATRGAHVGDWIFKIHKEEWQPDSSNRDKPNIPSSEPEKPYRPQTVADLTFTGGRPINADEVAYGRQLIYNPYGDLIGPKPSRQEKKELKENGIEGYFKTTNPLAEQLGWQPYTNPEFPCCPKEVLDNPIQDYAANLIEGKVFVSAAYGDSTVYKFTLHENQLLVITKIPTGIKSFALARVIWNGKVFVHESMGTFFDENGVMAAFTRAQGLEWNGPESVDDYC